VVNRKRSLAPDKVHSDASAIAAEGEPKIDLMIALVLEQSCTGERKAIETIRFVLPGVIGRHRHTVGADIVFLLAPGHPGAVVFLVEEPGATGRIQIGGGPLQYPTEGIGLLDAIMVGPIQPGQMDATLAGGGVQRLGQAEVGPGDDPSGTAADVALDVIDVAGAGDAIDRHTGEGADAGDGVGLGRSR
jgi:hypothetical protein